MSRIKSKIGIIKNKPKRTKAQKEYFKRVMEISKIIFKAPLNYD